MARPLDQVDFNTAATQVAGTPRAPVAPTTGEGHAFQKLLQEAPGLDANPQLAMASHPFVSEPVQNSSKGSLEVIATIEKTIAQIEQIQSKIASTQFQPKTMKLAQLSEAIGREMPNRLLNMGKTLELSPSIATDTNLAIMDQTPEQLKTLLPEMMGSLPLPIQRLVGFMARSQLGLNDIASEVRRLGDTSNLASPGDLLRIQGKISAITNQIDFFSGLVSQVLKNVNTMMNIQL